MAKKSNNRLAYGLIMLFFGIVYLLNKTGILAKIPEVNEVMNFGTFLLVAGLIFLCARTERTVGIIFTVIGLIINFDLFFGWLKGYSPLILPVIIIVVGLALVFTSKR